MTDAERLRADERLERAGIARGQEYGHFWWRGKTPADSVFVHGSLVGRLLDALDTAREEGVKAEREARAAERNAVYGERNRMVALLASLYPSSLERHDEADAAWEDDWRWIVFVDLPCGQATWHIHDSEVALFDHLPRHQGRQWDGHSTEEKYERIVKAIRERRS